MHRHDHDHHSHVDPAFELVESDCHQCGEHSAPHFNIECGHEHRIFGVNITHKPGDFIYWDSELELYVPAVEDKCDLMVLCVDHYGTWFEAANIGEFQLKNFTLKGPVYIDYVGELTNTLTNTKVGFIENGHLYLSIEHTVRGVAGPQGSQGVAGPQGPQGDPASYTLPIASSSVLGGVKVGNNLSIDVDGTLNATGGDSIFARGTGLNSLLAQIDPVADSNTPPTASGDYSLAIGANAVSGGLSSFAFGGYLLNLVNEPVSALGDYSFAFGKNVSVDDPSNYSSGFGSNNQIVNSPFSKVFGENSSITNSGKTVAYGGANTVTSSFYSMVIGSTNIATGLLNSIVGGFNNKLTGISNGVLLVGTNNTLTSGYGGFTMVAGHNNTTVSSTVYILGDSNNATESDDVLINGTGNTITSAFDSFITGYGNVIDHTTNYSLLVSGKNANIQTSSGAIFGYGHVLKNSEIMLVSGYTHTINGGSYSTILGNFNSILGTASYSLVGGLRVEGLEGIDLVGTIIYGQNLTVDTNTLQSSIVVGASFNVSGLMSSAIFGYEHIGISGGYNIVAGQGHTSTGYHDAVFGYGHVSSGSHNMTFGYNNTLGPQSEYSFVGGRSNIGEYEYQTIIGKFNENLSDSVLEIGYGLDGDNRTNIFRVTTSGISEQIGLILKPQASNPSTIVDGQMFSKADGLYVQIGGVLYKVNLTPA